MCNLQLCIHKIACLFVQPAVYSAQRADFISINKCDVYHKSPVLWLYIFFFNKMLNLFQTKKIVRFTMYVALVLSFNKNHKKVSNLLAKPCC